jgi:aminopeptidase YwaD
MVSEELVRKTKGYLNKLCVEIPTRRVGSRGNRDATAFFKESVEDFGFQTEVQPFNCIDMRQGDIQLRTDGHEFDAFISPYTLNCNCTAELVSASTVNELDCNCTAELVSASTVNELESTQAKEKIVLLYGEIAKEQLMPKNFVFYNPEEHQHIYRLLEEKRPDAVITATTKNPDAAGAIYPFPMIEDGDFDIPSAYMTEKEGKKLLVFSGKKVSLKMDAERIPSKSENIVASKGGRNEKKIVLCAHIDTKEGTPGALDNASGVSVLLLLAELLADYDGGLGVEIVALNGEEYYNAPGQVEYLSRYNGDFQSILLAVNLDDIGYYKDRTAYSFYGIPDGISQAIRKVYNGKKGFFEGPQWYQSDHGIFIANGIPAMAITEENFAELLTEITHTEKDTPEIVDPLKLIGNAEALADTIHILNQDFIGDRLSSRD